MSSAIRRASSAEVTAPGEPGTTGMRSACAVFLATTLSPIMAMCSGEGPMKTMPCSSTMAAKSAFSDRKPTPGWMASAPVMVAAERIAGTLR